MPDTALVLVLGAPRSGTTWIAKILDGHPDTRYRHEPDTVIREDGLPMLCPSADIGRYRSLAREYLQALAATRTVKTVGSRPMLRKGGEGAMGFSTRFVAVAAARALEHAAAALGRPVHLPMPGLLEPPLGVGGARRRAGRIVVKSVSSRGRAGLFADAAPLSRIVFVLRHPCGQVASMMRGAAAGKFDIDADFAAVLEGEVFATEQVRATGLTEATFRALPDLEKFAWNWALLNAKALDDLAAVRGGAGVRVVRYEDVCADPAGQARALLAFAGLPWDRAVDAFLHRSTNHVGPDRYYQVLKNAAGDPAWNWRWRLDATEQRRIMAVVAQTAMRRYWPECAAG